MNRKQVFGAGDFVYLKTELIFEDVHYQVTDIVLKVMLIKAVESLHGEATAAVPFDILMHNTKSGISILRVPSQSLVKIWSSLTLLGEHEGNRCTLLVKQMSPFLISLANSRKS
eukprot:m.6725 g.6725  ORF g.6725 m.6725 type:complete len:114 (+) comp16731_c0_seq1:85-426(+)